MNKGLWKIAIIFGSEEKGMWRLIKENYDYLVKIPMSNVIDTLNVSNIEVIGLYSIYTRTKNNCTLVAIKSNFMFDKDVVLYYNVING